MTEAETAAKFLLGGVHGQKAALDRIARWDEFTVRGGGWEALNCALMLEEDKRRPRPRVVKAIKLAMKYAGDGSHPANQMSPMIGGAR